jgi:hypothetical protein
LFSSRYSHSSRRFRGRSGFVAGRAWGAWRTIYARAAKRRFDVDAALTDAAGSDPGRRTRANAFLADGIARHVVYAGKRFRRDDLNSETPVVQQSGRRAARAKPERDRSTKSIL